MFNHPGGITFRSMNSASSHPDEPSGSDESDDERLRLLRQELRRQWLLQEQRRIRFYLLTQILLTTILLLLSIRRLRDKIPVFKRDSAVTTVNIKLSEKDTEGQFERLADELALSKSQQEEVRRRIMAIVEERTRGENIDPENKIAMANIMASTIRQELNQLGHNLDPKAIGKA